MVWFRVDDQFYGSKEVNSLPEDKVAAAIGLWTLAGAWSSAHLTDGLVPDYMIPKFGSDLETAALLVRPAKLWTRKRGAFQFRNWEKWQITRQEVDEKRQAERDRKAAYRQKRQQNTGDVPGVVPMGQMRIPDPPTQPNPSLPNPTQPIKENKRGTPVPNQPWCTRHPGGTDENCGPCRTARLAFEASLKEPKTKAVTTTPKRYKPDDGHKHHISPGGDRCELCEARIE